MDMLEKEINAAVDEFLESYGSYCKNELATLAYFHVFFFGILKEKVEKNGIKVLTKTIISNHIDKSPIVNFKHNSDLIKCELGDIFISCKAPQRLDNAILIQAKQNDNSYLQGSTRKEQILYNNWPLFEIIKPISNKSFKIDNNHNICSFLTFFSENGKFQMKSPNSDKIGFAHFLESFIKFNGVGRQYATIVQERYLKINKIMKKEMGCSYRNADDWSNLCRWLINDFFKKEFTNKHFGKGQKQLTTNLYFIDSSMINEIDDYLLKVEKDISEEESWNFTSHVEIISP